jgi:hypothetical protein
VDLLRSLTKKRLEITAGDVFLMENPDYLEALSKPFASILPFDEKINR